MMGILPLTTASRQNLEPIQLPIPSVPGALSPGLKRSGREGDHSPPSAEVKNAWLYTSTLQYVFMAWCLVKAVGQLYLCLLPVSQSQPVAPKPDLLGHRNLTGFTGPPISDWIYWATDIWLDLLGHRNLIGITGPPKSDWIYTILTSYESQSILLPNFADVNFEEWRRNGKTGAEKK
jgi:hypothetical protein